MLIVGFAGKARAGKSTAAEALRKLGKAVYVHKFAAPLYQIQETAYRLIQPVYQRTENFEKDRKFLQLVGTEWGRDTIRESLWVDLWTHRAKIVRDRDPEVVIACDDVRMDNEAAAVQSMGGVIVQIDSERPVSIGGLEGHKSEQGIDLCYMDYRISNNGTIEEFQDALAALFITMQNDLQNNIV